MLDRVGKTWPMKEFGKVDHSSWVILSCSYRPKNGQIQTQVCGQDELSHLSLLDRLERREDENRSIGIFLCAKKDRVEVELALENMGKPIGVADYQLIVPQEKLKKVVAKEVEAFGKELPHLSDTEEGLN